jgi:uncharacterized protein (TIGR01777 family)
MIIAITGASGFIGHRLIPRLQKEGYAVRALGRRDPGMPGVEFVRWDPMQEPRPEALQDVGAIVNLAGEPVAQRWNAEVKRRIRDSRVIGTRNLVNAAGKLDNRPGVLISASAIGYYGDRGDEILTESAPPGKDFLASVCVEWEQEARRAGEHGLRVVLPRIGIVLGREGGALKQMIPLFKSGVGGPVASGKQWVSWIHADDVTGLIAFALRHDHVFGILNATAPRQVRNVEFASLVPTPGFALKLMFGEMAQVVLASQRVVPEATLRNRYTFLYPELKEALREILT